MKKLFMIALMMIFAGIAGAADQVEIGAKAPEFSLLNAVDGKTVDFKANDGKLKVVIFTCNQCPFSKAFEGRLIEIGNSFASKGVVFYAIDSNDDARFPEETVENMKARAVEKNYPFPYLKDGDSKIARAYGARVTPHVFVVDGGGNIRYRGYVDDSAKPEERKTTGLSDALNSLLSGREVPQTVTREFGCSIKFKS